LVYPNGSWELVAEGPWTVVTFRGGVSHRFIATGDGSTVGISGDGRIEMLSERNGKPIISPDHSWMLFIPYGDKGRYPDLSLELYDANDEFVRLAVDDRPDNLIWRPDSGAFFYRIDSSLYYVAISDGQPVLVDENVATYQQSIFLDYGFVWIK